MASETCRAYMLFLINTILPELQLVGLLYIIRLIYIISNIIFYCITELTVAHLTPTNLP